MAGSVSDDIAIDPIETRTIKRVAYRLIPLLMLGYFCSYLDRANVGMAATTMNHQLGLSTAAFGFGSGLFFIGYFLAEIPSNLILHKVGARRWIARIMITWGLISGLTAFVWNDFSFYSVRFALGLAEAGFYPGVILYLTWWFPSHYRSRMMGIFQSASVVSMSVGPLIGGLLLNYMDGAGSLFGWQWLFLLEALPPIILCFVIWVLLTDRPKDAAWLEADQKAWLTKRLEVELAQREAVHKYSLLQAFSNPKMWLLTATYFCQTFAGSVYFFMPLIVQGLGVGKAWIGAVAALPFLCALVAMIWYGWHSDRTGERVWHTAISCLMASVGLSACILVGSNHPVLMMVALIVATIGQQCIAVVFWSIPSALLTGAAAAGGIAMINSVGNLGAFLGPWVFGLVKDATSSDTTALLCLAAGPLISTIAVLLAGRGMAREGAPTHAEERLASHA